MLAMTQEAMAWESVRSSRADAFVAYRNPARARASSSHVTRRSPAQASPRTYTRRRIVAALALTALVLAGWAALRVLGSTAAFGAPEHPLPMTPVAAGTYVVQPGETFWSIAHRLDPDADPRPVVDRLVAAHGTVQLRAGEVIVLPTTTHG